ncbi:MAG: 4-(cytidine 5'-diphospho)-2-C-methyl-D-erythritol kinase, partial [Gammaproteobacteria bacterium]
MSSITWPAPAKLNLFLHIIGRRLDGYHELQTVFQFIDYADELRFTPRPDGHIELTSALPDVPPEHNLIVRAARLLQAETKTSQGTDIELTKRLPIGAGLGGGSSDAATTLFALNRIWGLNLPLDELTGLGLRLGADVPVFLRGQAAWAEGVGERLTPIDLEEPWYVVVTPPCQVSTQAIFTSADLTRDTKPITIADFLAGQGGNDCEALVCRRYPEVAIALDWLGKFAKARMTGT